MNEIADFLVTEFGVGTGFGPGCPWFDLHERVGAPNIKWCEETLCSWINEPANAWSNLAYLIVAIMIWFAVKRDQNKTKGRIFSGVVFLMGLFSFFYHATNNYLTQIFDFFGMFLYVFLLFTLNLRRLGWVNQQQQGLIYGGSVFLGVLMIPVFRKLGIPYQLLIVGSMGGILVTELMCALIKSRSQVISEIVRSYRMFIQAAVFFLVAAIFSYLDHSRLFCYPHQHWLQGHALWHVFSAGGVYFSYLFYRSH